MNPTKSLAPAAIAFMVVCFIVFAAGGLSRAPFAGDEAIILSVSETLAERGQLGAPAGRGVFGAESHYFFSLPAQHLLHWPALKVFGVGAVQARSVSILAAVLLIVVAAVQSWRWAGWRAATAAVFLLVF
jgi:4-amino-4-deoxy-L-arabinose transferase-like glycosyltransferase